MSSLTTTRTVDGGLARLLGQQVTKRRRGAWRTEVDARRAELLVRLEVARALDDDDDNDAEVVAASDGETAVVGVMLHRLQSGSAVSPAVRAAHLQAVARALTDADAALDAGNAFRRLQEWWTGSAVTAAWESVHIAEAELVEVGPDEDVRAAIPRLRAWIKDVIPAKSRALYDDPLKAMQEPDAKVDRAVVRGAYSAAINMNNDKHAGLREFRNLLLAVSLGLGVILLSIGAWHALNPAALSLCSDAVGGEVTCFGGGSETTGRAVFEIEAIGALAGLLGVAYLLTKFKRTPARYNVLAAQAILKPIAGAAAALIGVLLLQSGLLIAPVAAGTAAMLAYAAVFGFSQELLTRFVDKKAARLLGEKESGSDEAD